jgi:sugar-specific transcriptional regulator TrmB
VLGLLESEAKLYIALATRDVAEVKELIDLAGISKPSAYESLRSLEEKGLITLINAKPIVYQATSPETSLQMLADTYSKAKEEANRLFGVLIGTSVNREQRSGSGIINQKSLPFKIHEMFLSATKNVMLAVSDKYLELLKPLSKRGLRISLVVFTEDLDAEKSIRKLFAKDSLALQVVNWNSIMTIIKSVGNLPLLFNPALEETYQDVVIAIVDNREMLSMLPFSRNAIYSRNEILIANMVAGYNTMIDFLSGGFTLKSRRIESMGSRRKNGR